MMYYILCLFITYSLTVLLDNGAGILVNVQRLQIALQMSHEDCGVIIAAVIIIYHKSGK